MFSVWQRPQIVWGGGDEAGGGGEGSKGRSKNEMKTQTKINTQLKESGGKFTPEINDLVAQRERDRAATARNTAGTKYTGLKDMFDGGGPGASGPQFRGGPFSGVTNPFGGGGGGSSPSREPIPGPRTIAQRIKGSFDGTDSLHRPASNFKTINNSQRQALEAAGYSVTKQGTVKSRDGSATVAGSRWSRSPQVNQIMAENADDRASVRSGGGGGKPAPVVPKKIVRPKLRPADLQKPTTAPLDYDTLYTGDPGMFMSPYQVGPRPSTYSPSTFPGGGDPMLADRPSYAGDPYAGDRVPSLPPQLGGRGAEVSGGGGVSDDDVYRRAPSASEYLQEQRLLDSFPDGGQDSFIDDETYETAAFGDTGFGKFLNDYVLGDETQLETTSGGGVASLPVPQPSPAVSVPPGRRDGPGSETEGNVYNTVLPDELIGAPMDSALQTEVRGNRAFETAPDQFGLQRRVYRGDPPDRNLTALEQGIYGLGENIARAGDVALDYGTDFFRTVGYRGGGPGVGRADVDSDVTMAQAMSPQTEFQKAYTEDVVNPAIANSQAAYDRLSAEAKAKLEGELSFDNVGTKLANMAPSIAVSTAAAVASLPAAIVAGVTLGVGGMDSQIEGAIQKEFDEGRLQNTPGFQDLKATGLSDAEAVLAYAGGISKQAAPIVASISAAGGSLSNAVLNGAVTKPLAKAISQKAAVQGATQTGRRGIVGPTVDAASRMAIEGLTEGMQEIAEAEIPSWYNDAQSLKQTAAQRKESGILGFLGGTSGSAGVSAAQGLGLGPRSRVGPTIESAPKPGDPDFVGPLPSPQGPNIPVPGDPGFVGPLQPSQGPTIPQAGDPNFVGPLPAFQGPSTPVPGDPNFIGPTQPTVAAAADVLSGTVPVPGDPDFVGPLPAVPRPGSSEFIGPLQLAPVAGDPNFVGPVAPVSGDPNFVGPVGLENQRGFDPSQVDTAAAQAAAITPEAQAEFDLLVPGGKPKSVGAAAGRSGVVDAILRKNPDYLPFGFDFNLGSDLDTTLQDIAFQQAQENREAGRSNLGATPPDTIGRVPKRETQSELLLGDMGSTRQYSIRDADGNIRDDFVPSRFAPTAKSQYTGEQIAEQMNRERLARQERGETEAAGKAAGVEAIEASDAALLSGLPVDPAGIGSLRNFPSRIPLVDSPAAQADRRRAIANRLKGEAEAAAMAPLNRAQAALDAVDSDNTVANAEAEILAQRTKMLEDNQTYQDYIQTKARLEAVNAAIKDGSGQFGPNGTGDPNFEQVDFEQAIANNQFGDADSLVVDSPPTTPQTEAQLAALTTPVETPTMAPLVAASPESVGEPDIIPPMQGPSIPVQGDLNFTGPLPSLEEQLLLDLEDKGIGALKPSRIIRGGKAPGAMAAAVPVTDPEISFEEAVAKVPMPKVRSTVSALKSQEGTPPVDTTNLEPLVLTDQKIKSDLGPDPFSLENRLARQRARFAEQENELAAAQRLTPTEEELKKGVGSLDAAENAAKRRKVPPTRRVVTGIDTERKDFTEVETPYFPELPTDDVLPPPPPEEREGGPSGPSDDRPAVVPVDMSNDNNDAQGCPPGYRRVLDPATGRYICLKIEEGSAGGPAAPAEEAEEEDGVVIDIPVTERPKISPYYVPEMVESNYTPYVPGRRARIFKDVAVRD